MQRAFIEAGLSRVARPIRIDDLRTLHAVWPHNSEKGDSAWAATLLAFQVLLRVSEYTADQRSPGGPLLWRHLQFHRDGRIDVTVAKSKTDQTAQGRYVTVHPIGGILCAAAALHRRRELFPRAPPHAPVFTEAPGTPLRRSVFIDIFSHAVHDARLQGQVTTHSLRRGGAVYLYEQNNSLEVIRKLGGWAEQSPSVFKYLIGVRQEVTKAPTRSKKDFEE
jgi:integrase